LRGNLESGASYLTQHCDDSQAVGAILADNIEAIASMLFGEGYTDEELEIVIDHVSKCTFNAYDQDCDIAAAAAAINQCALNQGGTGWM